jgi:hypothetical protein
MYVERVVEVEVDVVLVVLNFREIKRKDNGRNKRRRILTSLLCLFLFNKQKNLFNKEEEFNLLCCVWFSSINKKIYLIKKKNLTYSVVSGSL